jgi:FlaA1/EpsC-like NDP-sugar epimerase
MKKTLKIVTLPGLFLTDILFSLAAVIVGIAMRFDGQFAPQYVEIIPLFWAMTAVGLVGFGMLFGCYFNVWENASVNELVRQVMAVLATHVAIYVLNGAFDLGMPRGVIMAAFMVFLFATLSVRLAGRLVLWFVAYFRRNRSNPDAKRVLIVGAGDAGVFLAKRLFSQKDGNRQPVGFLDDNASLWNRWINGLPVFGGRRELADVVRRNGVKEVILAMKDADPELLKSLFASCQKLKVKVSRFDTLSQLDGESQTGARIREVSVEELLGREPVELDMEPVKALIQGATVLVTGGAGSIGSEICRQVLQWGCGHLVVFDFHENGLFDIGNELAAKYPATQYNLVLGSIRDERRLEEVFAKYKPSFVFHAAAHKHVPMMEWNPLEAVKNNIIGTWNVARKADAHGVRKMILISTDKAVNPTNIMGATKRSAPFQEADRRRRPGDGDTQGHHPLFHDHSGSLPAGASGRRNGQGWGVVCPGHGYPGSHLRPGGGPDSAFGAGTGNGYPHRLHRASSRGEDVRGAAHHRGRHEQNRQQQDFRDGAGRGQCTAHSKASGAFAEGAWR